MKLLKTFTTTALLAVSFVSQAEMTPAEADAYVEQLMTDMRNKVHWSQSNGIAIYDNNNETTKAYPVIAFLEENGITVPMIDVNVRNGERGYSYTYMTIKVDGKVVQQIDCPNTCGGNTPFVTTLNNEALSALKFGKSAYFETSDWPQGINVNLEDANEVLTNAEADRQVF